MRIPLSECSKENIMSNHNEAEINYQKYKDIDPFPDIEAALLNSGDIEDYVETTGMIDPFYEKNLKSGSYEAGIKGICKKWDEHSKEIVTKLEKENDTFELGPNSIAFLEVEPTFRLPAYIALRFNLKITNVYRGLLLGTGPLIDPGYEGKIYIPLHNLTSNTYIFEYGEGLIWIEFTKISKILSAPEYKGTRIPRKGTYKPFPESKKGKSLDYFLNKASKGSSIASSIPPEVKKAADSAAKAENSAEKAKSRINLIGWGGAILVIIAVVALALPAWQLQYTYIDDLNDLRKEITEQDKLIRSKTKLVSELDHATNTLLNKVEEQNKLIVQLQNIVTELNTIVKHNDDTHQ
ncbi:MAG: hypothetical protein ABFS45_02070 [Pseudomonadota bacterium]